MKKSRKNKGFTLVELIVVLVILAILAAMLVPALTGYIDKANEKVVAAEARAALMASQTLVSDFYGKASLTTFPAAASNVPAAAVPTGINVGLNQIESLAEVKAGTVKKVRFDTGGKVIFVEYENAAYAAIYCKTATEVADNTNCARTSETVLDGTLTKAVGWVYCKLK